MYGVGLERKENQYILNSKRQKFVVCLRLNKENSEKKSQHQELHINNNVFNYKLLKRNERFVYLQTKIESRRLKFAGGITDINSAIFEQVIRVTESIITKTIITEVLRVHAGRCT